MSTMRRALAWAILVVSLGLCVAAAALLFASRSAPVELDFAYRGLIGLPGVTLAVVGWVIARHRPDNPIGWVFLLSGLCASIGEAGAEYGVYGGVHRPGSLPAVGLADWFGSIQWVFFIGILGTYGSLLFPDGRPPSPRWRIIGYLAPVGMILIAVSVALRPGRIESLAGLPNPFDRGWDPVLAHRFEMAALPFFVGTLVVAVSSLVIRYRRSGPATRNQIKWMVCAAVPLPVTVAVGGLMSASGPAAGTAKFVQTLAVVALAGVPVGAAVGILRHRLYDIDRIINRTVVYAVVSGLLLGCYAVAVLLFGRVLRPVTGGSAASVAAATLATLTVFRPVLRRVQAIVDRRFNRSRYDAARTLEAFAGSLREEVELSTLVDELRRVVAGTIGPERVDVWLPGRGT